MRACAIAVVLLTLSSMAAWGQPVGGPPASAPSVAVVDHRTTIRVAPGGRATHTLLLRVELRDAAAVSAFGQLMFPYLPEHERITLTRLLVIKADGTRHDLSDITVDDISNPQNAQLPDARARHIAVPNIAPGDTLEYEVLTETLTPIVEPHFWAGYDFTRTVPVRHEQFEVRAQPGVDLLVIARPGLDIPATERTEGDDRVWSWEHSVDQPDIPDVTRPGALEVAMREPSDVVISTFPTWDTLGRWFADVVRQRAEVTPKVRAQALSLTKNMASDRDRFAALVAYVSEKIRYLSLPLGARRYAPRPADEVLTSAYGDCKDKHTLLAALAAAAEIDVRPVLIHSFRDLIDAAPSVGQFDHVVSLARLSDGVGVWADTTAAGYPAGVLPQTLRGRRGVLIDAAPRSTATSVTARPIDTPESTAVTNESVGSYTGTVSATGEIAGRVEETYRGDMAFALRLTLRQVGLQGLETLVNRLASDGQGEPFSVAAGTFDVRGAEDASAPFVIRFNGSRTLKPDTMRKVWTFRPPVAVFRLDAVRANINAPARTTPILMGTPSRMRLEGRYELPPGTTATAPKGATLSQPFADYRATYRVDGATVHVLRELTTKQFRITPDQFPAYEAFLKDLDEDGRKQFSVSAVPVDLTLPTTTADDLARAGVDALTAGDAAKAEALLRRATEREATHKSAWRDMGRALVQLGRREDAEAAFLRQQTIAPADDFNVRSLAHVQIMLGKNAEAESSLRTLLDTRPRDEWAWSALGDALARQRKWREAAEAFEQASSVSSTSAHPLFRLAAVRMLLREPEQAYAALDQAVERAPTAVGYGQAASARAVFAAPSSRVQRYASKAFVLAAEALDEVTLSDPITKWLPPSVGVALATNALGIIAVSRGDRDAAEQLFRAAWMVFEYDDAARRLAILLDTPDIPPGTQPPPGAAVLEDARSVLEAGQAPPSGPGSPNSPTGVRLRTEYAQAQRRAFTLKGKGDAQLVVSIGSDGMIDEVRFVSGDEPMRVTAQGLIGKPIDFGVKLPHPMRLIRRAGLSCAGDSACVLALEPVVPKGFDLSTLF